MVDFKPDLKDFQITHSFDLTLFHLPSKIIYESYSKWNEMMGNEIKALKLIPLCLMQNKANYCPRFITVIRNTQMNYGGSA